MSRRFLSFYTLGGKHKVLTNEDFQCLEKKKGFFQILEKSLPNPGNSGLFILLHCGANAQAQCVQLDEAGRVGLVVAARLIKADDFRVVQ